MNLNLASLPACLGLLLASRDYAEAGWLSLPFKCGAPVYYNVRGAYSIPCVFFLKENHFEEALNFPSINHLLAPSLNNEWYGKHTGIFMPL
jgi:hypothetical protein